jgi:ADP-ribose pyrophosphatase
MKIERPKSHQQKSDAAKIVFNGKLFDVWQWEQEQFDGSTKTFELLKRPDTVLVLPVLAGKDVVLCKEQQPGTKIMFRTIGGRIEKGETPEEAAQRELYEETGYEAKEFRLWDAWQPSNKIDWVVYLFVAHGLIQKSDGSLDSGEKISLVNYPIDKLLDPNNELDLDDNEFLFKLHFAQGNSKEKSRIINLLSENN